MRWISKRCSTPLYPCGKEHYFPYPTSAVLRYPECEKNLQSLHSDFLFTSSHRVFLLRMVRLSGDHVFQLAVTYHRL